MAGINSGDRKKQCEWDRETFTNLSIDQTPPSVFVFCVNLTADLGARQTRQGFNWWIDCTDVDQYCWYSRCWCAPFFSSHFFLSLSFFSLFFSSSRRFARCFEYSPFTGATLLVVSSSPFDYNTPCDRLPFTRCCFSVLSFILFFVSSSSFPYFSSVTVHPACFIFYPPSSAWYNLPLIDWTAAASALDVPFASPPTLSLLYSLLCLLCRCMTASMHAWCLQLLLLLMPFSLPLSSLFFSVYRCTQASPSGAAEKSVHIKKRKEREGKSMQLLLLFYHWVACCEKKEASQEHQTKKNQVMRMTKMMQMTTFTFFLSLFSFPFFSLTFYSVPLTCFFLLLSFPLFFFIRLWSWAGLRSRWLDIHWWH